jgi:hypothetical protein
MRAGGYTEAQKIPWLHASHASRSIRGGRGVAVLAAEDAQQIRGDDSMTHS